MSMEFKGLDKLEKRLKEKAEMTDVKEVMKANGAELQEEAMRRAPVDTGALKRSITLEIEDFGLTARIGSTMEYAQYVELGTRFVTEQPFMKPAYFQQRHKLIKDLSKLME